jgi:hypothetical protein
MLETRVVDIDLLMPEGAVAAIQGLIGQGVHALAHSFAIIPQPAMDVAAVTGTPCLHGSTGQASLDPCGSDPQKYRNMFQVDVAGRWYGAPYLGRQGGGLGAQEQPRPYRAMALLMAWMPPPDGIAICQCDEC